MLAGQQRLAGATHAGRRCASLRGCMQARAEPRLQLRCSAALPAARAALAGMEAREGSQVLLGAVVHRRFLQPPGGCFNCRPAARGVQLCAPLPKWKGAWWPGVHVLFPISTLVWEPAAMGPGARLLIAGCEVTLLSILERRAGRHQP